MLDEELRAIINRFRIKLGEFGEFIVIVDAGFGWDSHSDEKYTRGGNLLLEPSYQMHTFAHTGKNEIGIMDDQPFSIPSTGYANLFHLSANQIHSVAHELNGNGILSLAFARELEELTDSISYESFYQSVKVHAYQMYKNQIVVAEGDIETIIFNFYLKTHGSSVQTFNATDTTVERKQKRMIA
ncbi:MAG: hypothetical protein ACI9JN_000078 [Bacteroidia bacterium]